MEAEHPEYIQDMIETANEIDGGDFPQDQKFDIVASRPFAQSITIRSGIQGYYHALNIRDQVQDELGFVGVSLSVEEAE